MPFLFYAVIAKEPASPPLHEHPASSRIRSPTKLAISYSFFNPFVFLLLLPSYPLNFFFPSDLLSLFHVAILSTFSKTLHFFHTGIFHSFIVFHSSLSFFLQVYYGVTSTHTYFCPSRLRSFWGCVGLTVPALPPSAGHPFPTPHMHLVSTYSLFSLSQSITSCLVCLLSTRFRFSLSKYV